MGKYDNICNPFLKLIVSLVCTYINSYCDIIIVMIHDIQVVLDCDDDSYVIVQL